MFREQESMSHHDHAEEVGSSEEQRLQYTIKGIERRSVDLMRTAAKRDGMKIGAWVSMRMREAAEASLRDGLPSYVKEQGAGDPRMAVGSSLESILIERLDLLQREMDRLRQNQDILISGLIAKGRE